MFGTLMLSSIMFNDTFDALNMSLRKLLSVLLYRMILIVESAGMNAEGRERLPPDLMEGAVHIAEVHCKY
jgi:hypothetical protein